VFSLSTFKWNFEQTRVRSIIHEKNKPSKGIIYQPWPTKTPILVSLNLIGFEIYWKDKPSITVSLGVTGFTFLSSKGFFALCQCDLDPNPTDRKIMVIYRSWPIKSPSLINKRAQRALGRSPKEKVTVEPFTEDHLWCPPNIGRRHQIWKLWALYFQTRRFLKVAFWKSIFRPRDLLMQPIRTIWTIW